MVTQSTAKPWQPTDQLSLQQIHFMGLRPHKWTEWHWKRLTNIARHGKWRILGSWPEKSHIEFVMSLGLGRTISLYVSSYYKKQQIFHFLAKYLIQWKKAPSSKRSKMCGNALFLKLQKLKEDHVRQGHYYLEYLKFACEPIVSPGNRKVGQQEFLGINFLFRVSVTPDTFQSQVTESTSISRAYK